MRVGRLKNHPAGEQTRVNPGMKVPLSLRHADGKKGHAPSPVEETVALLAARRLTVRLWWRQHQDDATSAFPWPPVFFLLVFWETAGAVACVLAGTQTAGLSYLSLRDLHPSWVASSGWGKKPEVEEVPQVPHWYASSTKSIAVLSASW